jgi:hypothetical protein
VLLPASDLPPARELFPAAEFVPAPGAPGGQSPGVDARRGGQAFPGGPLPPTNGVRPVRGRCRCSPRTARSPRHRPARGPQHLHRPPDRAGTTFCVSPRPSSRRHGVACRRLACGHRAWPLPRGWPCPTEDVSRVLRPVNGGRHDEAATDGPYSVGCRRPRRRGRAHGHCAHTHPRGWDPLCRPLSDDLELCFRVSVRLEVISLRTEALHPECRRTLGLDC